MSGKEVGYDNFLAEIYDYSPYFGKERFETGYATEYYINHLPDKKDGKVLELVTCTGGLTIPMARAGYKVDSIDASAAVQDIVKSKLKEEPLFVSDNIMLKCVDVFNYETDKKYSALVMPDSFLHAVADERLQEKLIEKCNELLDNGGVLIADIFVPWKNVIEKKELNQCSRFRTKEGKLYIVYAHHKIDIDKQLHIIEFTHELYGKGIKCEHTVVYRYMYLRQMIELLERNGFIISDVDENMNFGTNVAVVAIKERKCMNAVSISAYRGIFN